MVCTWGLKKMQRNKQGGICNCDGEAGAHLFSAARKRGHGIEQRFHLVG